MIPKESTEQMQIITNIDTCGHASERRFKPGGPGFVRNAPRYGEYIKEMEESQAGLGRGGHSEAPKLDPPGIGLKVFNLG